MWETVLEIAISAIAIAFTLYAVFSIIIYSLYNGISPMPSSQRVKKKLIEIADNYLASGKVFELGAGWGTLAFPLARNLPHCQVIGYENSLIPYIFSKFILLLFPSENLKLIRKNFYRASLSDADVIMCYLHPGAMERLKVKFEEELQRDCLVISSTFAIPEWKPIQITDVSNLYRTRIYIYRVGISDSS